MRPKMVLQKNTQKSRLQQGLLWYNLNFRPHFYASCFHLDLGLNSLHRQLLRQKDSFLKHMKMHLKLLGIGREREKLLGMERKRHKRIMEQLEGMAKRRKRVWRTKRRKLRKPQAKDRHRLPQPLMSAKIIMALKEVTNKKSGSKGLLWYNFRVHLFSATLV